MRWLKTILFLLILFFGLYAAAMYFFVAENKTFKTEKEIDYPLDKVFTQFASLQNFTQWNDFFVSNRDLGISYYEPYEGQGSSLSFTDKKKKESGELFIRYLNPNKTVKYQFFQQEKENPSQIGISFKALSPTKTRITWLVTTPKLPVLARISNISAGQDFTEDIDKSMLNLKNVMENKVDKEQRLATVKYDSIMVENRRGSLLLGVNVSTANKADSWYKNIGMNHNKVYSYLTTDMQKRDDEIGVPVLITNASSYKDKNVSYFYGIPVSKRESVSDNNFSFRTLNAAKTYTVYYKGSFKGSANAVRNLIARAEKEGLRYGDVQIEFIEPPANTETVLKISVPVFL